jgi:hypothetical protein
MIRDTERVNPTADEMAAYHRKYGPRSTPRVYRVRCLACGRRFWGSGLGIGAHRRACPGAKP